MAAAATASGILATTTLAANNAATWISPTTGSWTVGANWSGGVVPNAATDSANFVLLPASSASSVVILDANQTVGSLTFNTPFRTSIVPLTTGQSSLTISGGTVTVDAGPFETADVFPNGHTLAVNIAGANGLVKNGSGNLTLADLAGFPTVTSTFTGGVTVNGGTLTVTTDSQLGAAANNITLKNGTSLHVFNSTTFTTARSIALPASGTADLTVGTHTVVNGVISGTGANLTTGMNSGGNLILRASNTFSGATVLRDNGGLILDGSSGAIASSSRLDLGGALFLNLTAANSNRIADTTDVYSYGGFIAQTGRSSATSETMGALHLVNGGSTIAAVDATTSTIAGRLTFASLDRQNRATVHFRGRNLGNTPAAGVGNVFFTTAPSPVGGNGAAGSKNISIIPFATGQTDVTTLATAGLVTYAAGGGVRPLAATEYQTTLAAGGATDNYKLTAGEVNNAAKTVNALVIGGTGGSGGSVTGSGTLAITSGALVCTDISTDPSSSIISNSIDFGSAEGVISNLSTFANLFIDGRIYGTNGVTFAGGGATALANVTNTWSGQNTITRGIVQLHGSVALTGDSAIGSSTLPLIITPGNNTDVAASANVVSGSTFAGMVMADPNSTYARDIVIRNNPGVSIRQGKAIVGTNINDGTGSVVFSGNISVEGGTLVPLAPATAIAPIPNDLTKTGLELSGVISGVGRVDDFDIYAVSGLSPSTNNQPVIRLSGANTYSGGTSITNSLWQVNSSSVLSGNTMTSGPFGTGTIGFEGQPSTFVPAALGAMQAFGAPRTVANPIVYLANPHFVGSQTLTLSGTHNLAGRIITFDVSSSADVLLGGTVSGGGIIKTGTGRLVLAGSNTYTGGTNVNTGTVLIATTGTVGTGVVTVGGSTLLDVAAGRPDALKISGLAIAGTGTLDLRDADLIIGSATTKSQVEAYVSTGRNNGLWNVPGGITSTNARNLSTTGLGVLSGAEYTSVGGNGTFSGQTYAAGDTLVKYTWNGDANLDGRITFDDYVKIDTGFNTQLTGWLNGDFNYSGNVSFDDYVLIDIAFNQQSGTLARAIDWISGDDRSTAGLDGGVATVIDHFGEFGTGYGTAFLAAVPEPTSLALLGIPALAGIVRPRRRARR